AIRQGHRGPIRCTVLKRRRSPKVPCARIAVVLRLKLGSGLDYNRLPLLSARESGYIFWSRVVARGASRDNGFRGLAVTAPRTHTWVGRGDRRGDRRLNPPPSPHGDVTVIAAWLWKSRAQNTCRNLPEPHWTDPI